MVVMHHMITKNLQSEFPAMHRCEKSQQSQVPFARGSAAESSTLIPRYHKILILYINSMVLYLPRVVYLSASLCISVFLYPYPTICECEGLHVSPGKYTPVALTIDGGRQTPSGGERRCDRERAMGSWRVF